MNPEAMRAVGEARGFGRDCLRRIRGGEDLPSMEHLEQAGQGPATERGAAGSTEVAESPSH